MMMMMMMMMMMVIPMDVTPLAKVTEVRGAQEKRLVPY